MGDKDKIPKFSHSHPVSVLVHIPATLESFSKLALNKSEKISENLSSNVQMAVQKGISKPVPREKVQFCLKREEKRDSEPSDHQTDFELTQPRLPPNRIWCLKLPYLAVRISDQRELLPFKIFHVHLKRRRTQLNCYIRPIHFYLYFSNEHLFIWTKILFFIF